ncbi:MAG: 50S ribosomal protein L29 [Candidatus Levybacteria bacterium]|nr:50S ribosomal protein L29 [Candidatus Levybacteria bacterium]
MKTKDIKDLHSKTEEELKGMYKIAKEDLLELNLSKSLAKLKNTSSIFSKKKDIARILTILRGKELANENN